MLDAPVASREQPRGWLLLALLAVVVALAVGLRAWWISHLSVDPLDGHFDDSVFYFLTAKGLAQDLAYRDPYRFGAFTAHWPPGYPLVLSGVFAVTGTHLLAAKALNVAISAATVLLTYAVGARVFGRRTGLVAALLIAVAPGHIFFAPLVMTEVLFAFGFLVVVAMLIWWTIDVAPVSWRWWFGKAGDPVFDAPSVSRLQEPRMFALGIATGALTLVRAEAVALLVIFTALWLVILPRWRPLLWYTAIFLSGFVLTMTPWAARNYARLDKIIVLRQDEGGAVSAAFDSHHEQRGDRYLASQLPPPETASYWLRHPWELVPLEWTKLRNLYSNDSDGIGWSSQKLDPAEARRLSRLADRYFFAVGASAIAAIVIGLLRRARDRRRNVLAYLVVAWTATLIVAWPQTRYHMPLLPILSMFAAWTIVRAAGSLFAGIATAKRALRRLTRVSEVAVRTDGADPAPPDTSSGGQA